MSGGKGQGYDGNAAEVRVRGNAYQVLEKYLQLARDAGTVGDRVAAENFLQHADHYYRVVAAMQEGQRPRIGGRDVSVAEVNVQNGSQGLSTALYSGHPQSGAQQGDSDGNGGEKAVQGDSQGGQQNNDHQNSGRQNNNGNQNAGHQNAGHQNPGHQNPGRHGSAHQSGGHQGGNYQGGGQGGDRSGGRGGSPDFNNGPSEPVSAQPSYTPPKIMDEQPDYPVDLLPVAVAPVTGVEGNGEPAPADAERGQDRGGRGPARGRGRRPARRPRQDGDSGPVRVDSGGDSGGDSGE
jgi:hypothetical protein